MALCSECVFLTTTDKTAVNCVKKCTDEKAGIFWTSKPVLLTDEACKEYQSANKK